MFYVKHHREMGDADKIIFRKGKIVNHAAENETENQTGECAHHSNGDALSQKNLPDVFSRKPLRFQNSDVLEFILNRHTHDIVNAESGNHKQGK